MKREEIKELYSIDNDKGTLLIIKRDVDKWLSCKDEWSYTPNVLVNPRISINKSSGVLTIIGIRLSYRKVRVNDFMQWLPKPVMHLGENWENMIFYKEEDIINKDYVEFKGNWPFRRRKKYKNIDHLKGGYYLNTNGYEDTQITSNYRIDGLSDGQLDELKAYGLKKS